MRWNPLFMILGVAAFQGCDSAPPGTADAGGALSAAAFPGLLAGSEDDVQDTMPMVVRRVWHYSDGLEFWGGPSPDGRFLTYVDWGTGDLALHDFVSGEDRHLTDEASFDDSEFAVISTVSPDGKQVAYSWENGRYDELRILSLEDSKVRVVISDSTMNIHPQEWSASGEVILVAIDLFRAEEGEPAGQLGLVSVDQGSLQIIKSLGGRGTFEESLSPDGQMVIYDYPSEERGPADRDIFLIEAETGEERVLVDHPANDVVLGWAPDGRHVFFASDRTGTLAAWLLPVSDGRAAGGPILVKPELWRINPLGFTKNGAFYYGVEMSMTDVFLATIDSDTGHLLEPPTRISQTYHGGNAEGEWSPDGRFLAYLSKRSLIPRGNGSEVIVIRSNETGEVRELHPRLGLLHRPKWSPDGRSILVWSSGESGQKGLFLVDVQTGQEQPLLFPSPGEGALLAEWGPDDKTLFINAWDGEGRRIGIRDLEGGPERVLVRASQEDEWVSLRSDFCVSPNGQELAFQRRTGNGPYSLEVVAVSSGEIRKLAEFPSNGPSPLMVEWGPDGRYIYYLRAGGSEYPEDKGLWRVLANGGTPEQLDWSTEVECYPTGFQPNGNRIALTCREGEGGDEVWVMEDFLPEANKAERERRLP